MLVKKISSKEIWNTSLHGGDRESSTTPCSNSEKLCQYSDNEKFLVILVRVFNLFLEYDFHPFFDSFPQAPIKQVCDHNSPKAQSDGICLM